MMFRSRKRTIPSKLRISRESGFTMLEFMVSITMFGVVGGIVVSATLLNQNIYYDDVVRTKIRGNLRTSMDMLGMNIKQAGENLTTLFPALEMIDGNSGAPDTLILRRNIISEVLTLCTAANQNDTQIKVSSSLANPACVDSTVSASHAVWEAYRQSEGGTIRVYIYDYIGKVGEFLDYTSGGDLFGSDYFLTVSELSNNYPVLTTNIYVLEEYRFELDSSSSSLRIYNDGDLSSPKTVAFGVTDFQVSADMNDGTAIATLNTSSSYDWKDISMISIVVTGVKTRKNQVISTSISGRYFPRNIMSR